MTKPNKSWNSLYTSCYLPFLFRRYRKFSCVFFQTPKYSSWTFHQKAVIYGHLETAMCSLSGADLAFISSAECREEFTNTRNILVHTLHLESNNSPPHEWQWAPISVLFANARSNKETKLAFWNTVPDGSYWWHFSDSLKDNQIDFLSHLVHIFSLLAVIKCM